MDETLLLNKSIQDNGVLPNLQNNLLALDLMRKSGSDVENESMLVKYSPEPSIIKSIESHSFLNNTSLESIFPRGCQDNRLWAKSLKDSLNLSKTGNNSMNETLKTSPKNAMRRKLENKHKMDLTVNLTFNDTDKEISLSESSSKTNPFVKLANCKKYSVNLNLNDTDKEISLSESGSKTNPFVKLANCKKYSVNLNLNETTQLSSDVLGTISSAENSLLSEKPSENVFKTLNNIKYSPVIDLSLTENSEIEEEVRHPILASNGRRSKKYSVKFDLDSSCDSLKNKTVHTNNFSNLKNEDEQFDLIPNKKIIDLKETRHDDTTKDKENQSFQIETPPCDSRRNGKVRSSSRKPKGKNSNQIGSATDDDKINASIVNSTKDESQTTMNTENVPTSTIECVEPSPRINKTELEKEKSVDHKAEETKLKSINNESQTERCVVECDQIVTHERSLSDNLLQNPVVKPFQNCLDTSNVEISTNVDSLNVTLKVPLDPKGKSKEHSAIEVEQSGLDVKHNSNVGELTSDHNYTVNLQGKNIKAPKQHNIKENILKQLEEGKNDIVTARPDDLAHKDVSSVPVKKNLPKNKKKKSAKVVTEDISSRKTDSSLETTQMSQITDITLNVSSYESLDVSLDAQESYTQKECLAYHSSPMYKSRSKILNTLDQEVKCILKKDSMEYVETHVMDYVQSDSFDLDDCPMERPKLVEKNDSFRLVENCSNPFFPNINEVDNSSQVEIPYLSKTIIDELDSTSTESNLVVENQQELNLIRSSLENNKELQDENERENVISIPSKCTIDDNDEHANDCSSGVKTLSLENNNEVCLQTESQVDVISIPKFDDNNKEVNDGSNKVKTPSSSKQTNFEQTNNTNFENSQTKNKENDCWVGMEEQQKTQKMSQEFATADLLEDDLQHSNGTSQIAVVESIPEVINEKLAQRDIPQNAEKGEQHITESESDVNSHSGKSKQSNSQFKLVEDKRMSADDENGHVTTLIENNLPGKNNSFNFTIASEPSKQVSSHKSKTNTTNETVNETTPAKRTRSSTRKSKMSDTTINVNDKLAQKDIPQQAKEGERLITESELDANSHSGNSKQLESQFMLAKCSMVSANDENGHVTTLVENNLLGKDNSINLTIASEPSKQVSSQKSKINTTNEAVNETTPAKRTRSSTRKSKMSDKSINVNDKLAQKDIPQQAKAGEPLVTESESDANSHSGNSKQLESQFMLAECSMVSANDENGHVTTLVENNLPGKDNSINFTIASEPSKQVSSQKSKINTTNEAVNETTPAKRTRSSTRKSKMSDKSINVNDKLAQKDIPQQAKEGEPLITESESDANSHSGNSKQLESQFMLAECSMVSANDENGHVTTLVENNLPGKDNSINFTIASEPSKQVSSQKSKINTTNEAVNETTPAKRTRSSTRKSKMSDKSINVNDKLAQKDIPQQAKAGEPLVTESESDANSHSGNSKQLESQFMLAECSMVSANDENGHVTTLVENNLPGKDNSINFTIASEPSKQVSSQKSKINTTNEAVNETTPAKRTRSSTRKSKMSDKSINVNDKLAQKDIPQQAKEGEPLITESESDANSHSGNSKQLESQFMLAECSMVSANDENGHVTTLVENNLPGKDNSINFTIASEPSKQVSSQKSKINTTNEAVNETTPAKRTRSSTRKSKMSDKSINVNDKLAQKDIPQQAKEGEPLITESESDANSHSGNSKQLESQFMLAECSMVSANDENGHVTTLVENNLPGKDNSINFIIASEPSKQVSSQKSKINTTNEAVNETTPAKRTRSSTRKSKMSDKTINVNDKLAQKDIPQQAKAGEPLITESESDANSHSGNSKQLESQFMLAECSMVSANDENGHVTTLVENNLPGKDNSINFTIASEPSKQVSSQKSKINTTNEAVNETTPAKRTRSSTRKSKMSDKSINVNDKLAQKDIPQQAKEGEPLITESESDANSHSGNSKQLESQFMLAECSMVSANDENGHVTTLVENNLPGKDNSINFTIASEPSKQVSSQKSKINTTNEAVNETTPAKRTRSSTKKSKMSDKSINVNDKLAQKDIPQPAKEGEQHITESESDVNSHSGNSTQSKSQFKRVKRSRMSADEENGHVRTVVENNHPGKDDSINFAIPSLPSKRVSSRKSKANTTNVAVKETKTPTKRNRSSTRKSKTSDKTISNLSYDSSLDVSSINQSFPHKKVLIYHSTPFHKVPIKQSYRKAIYQADNVDNGVGQSNSRRSTRRNISVDQNNCIESIYNHDKSSVNEQFCTSSTRSKSRSSQQKNSLLETKDSFTVSNSQGDFDATSIDSNNSLNLNSKSIISQPPHLDPIEKHMLKIKTALNKNKRKQDSVFDSKEITSKKRKMANTFTLPKLYKPAKWVNKRLYQFLEKSLSDKYKLEARKVSEEFVITLYHTYTLVIHGHTEPSLSNLKAKLKELGLCRTQLDFFLFVINYMPFNFRKLVVPLSGAYNTPIQPKILPFDEL